MNKEKPRLVPYWNQCQTTSDTTRMTPKDKNQKDDKTLAKLLFHRQSHQRVASKRITSKSPFTKR